MKRLESSYIQAPPSKRPLKIFASDPIGGRSLNRISIEVKNDTSLQPGPVGDRIEVVDYDGAHDRFYPPVDLDDRSILMQGGLDATESDPRFHQQMVYAVATRTLENFDFALGRRIDLRRRSRERLRLFPHAFHGANAFYDPELHAVLFGYFRADRKNPGPNLPGQNVFTCLSHDIIVHEVTHALVHRLRRYFLEPSNRDVLAFHEGFSDIVSLFQHFSFQDLLRDEIQKTRTDIRTPNMLVQMARQFGYATGKGRELRSAIGKPDATLYDTVFEPHQRGAILVAAVFDAFFENYQQRTRDLIRIATGGTGTLPEGDLHPDLVNRVASEASRAAQTILTMCIRAFDYLPPVDITFGDYLRAMVTADYELVPDDEHGRRSAMIEAFRRRGLYPKNVVSLAEESLLWDENPNQLPPLNIRTLEMLEELTLSASAVSRSPAGPSFKSAPYAQRSMEQLEIGDEGIDAGVGKAAASQLHAWADANADALLLDPARPIAVHGFHPVFRVAPDGALRIELVAQFVQHDGSGDERFGGIPVRGGTTVIAAADGAIRYVIAKPLPSAALPPEKKEEAEARIEEQRAYVEACDARDPLFLYGGEEYRKKRMEYRMQLLNLHGGA
ncbi:MAG: hypothetical protein ACRD2J_01090 [Thermoanaerobaculia bacterium]